MSRTIPTTVPLVLAFSLCAASAGYAQKSFTVREGKFAVEVVSASPGEANDKLVLPILRRLNAYAPDPFALESRVFLVLDGGSPIKDAGYGDIYIYLQEFAGNRAGVSAFLALQLSRLVVTNDHIAGAHDAPRTIANCLSLVESVFEGGLVFFLSEPFVFAPESGFFAPQVRAFLEDPKKLAQHFLIFEMSLLRLRRDQFAEVDQLEQTYSARFAGETIGSFTLVGYHMARQLEREGGAEQVARLMDGTALDFFDMYQKLCGDREGTLSFTPEVLDVLAEMADYVNLDYK